MQTKTQAKTNKGVLDRLEEMPFIRAIRRGLIMTIPLLMIGSFSLIFNIMPIPAYQAFLSGAGAWLSRFFVAINQVTFGVLSLCITMSVSVCYARIRHSSTPVIAGSLFSSLCAYAIFVGLFTDDFNIASFGAQGMFTALFSAVAGSALYCWLVEKRWFTFKLYTMGADVDFNMVLSVIFPVMVVVVAAFGLNALISAVLGVTGFEAMFYAGMERLFGAIPNLSIKALLFIVLSSVLWFFGIHGTNVLEGVAQSIFFEGGEQLLLGVLNKPVIDVFIWMGGCGSTISLLVAILLFSKRKNNRSLGRLAAFPMLFNINELVVFGLPIVFNTAYFVPFILVPLVNIAISGLALAVGFVPQPQAVSWVLPIFVNGFQATGTIRGVLLQLVNILVGAAIYRWFLLRDEARNARRMSRSMDELVQYMQAAESRGERPVLLELKGNIGGLTKMLAADLRHMLQNTPENLKMFYQPQYNDKNQCVGAEALLRIQHPLCGTLYPPLAIGIVEEAGLLGQLERAVFHIACGDIVTMQSTRTCPPSVSVNATAATLQDEGFVEYLQQLLELTPSVKDVLCIELTEQMSFTMGEVVEERLRQIRELGVRFEVDDFSMGHTSVKYLQSDLFEVVKLDGSLVKDMMANSRSVEIIWSIIQMADTMGFRVMAEYVETEEQRDMLREMGCRLYQGYLFSPAIPLEAFVNLMKEENALAPAASKAPL